MAETHCPCSPEPPGAALNKDGTPFQAHCECWYGCDPCCWCGDDTDDGACDCDKHERNQVAAP